MANIKYSKIFLAKQRARKLRNLEKYQKAIKSIEKDEEYQKLYNIVKQKYLDNGESTDNITMSEVMSLDFDYFAITYGEDAFIAREEFEIL